MLALLSFACVGQEPPNVLLITIDTQRADFLGCYGHPVVQTPTLDSLAASGVLFLNATSQCNQTIPSHASLFTSRYVPELGTLSNFSRLPRDVPTMSEHLAGLGYSTGAVVSTLVLKADRCGLDRGFRDYMDIPVGERIAWETLATAKSLIGSLKEPFFVWVHFFDPHRQYTPPPSFESLYWTDDGWVVPDDLEQVTTSGEVTPELAEYMQAHYMGEVTVTDWALGQLLGHLRGMLDPRRTLLVVTADHGESMTEHGILFEHGWAVYQTHVHVPLILSWPGHLPEGGRVSNPVELVDVPVTILDLIGARPLPGARGRSLVDAWEHGDRSTPLGCMSHQEMLLATAWRRGPWKLIRSTQKYYRFPLPGDLEKHLAAASVLRDFSGRMSRHAILSLAGTWSSDIRRVLEEMEARGLVDVSERIELYNLDADPGEEEDLAALLPDTVQALMGQLELRSRDIGRHAASPGYAALSEHERDQLRALGYLD
jgi:arylsulfatase A-like enzyme